MGENGIARYRTLSDSIPEGETRRINFANIYLTGEVTSPIPRDDTGYAQTSKIMVSGGKSGVIVGSGEGVRVKVDVSGSYEGFNAEIFSLDPQIGVTGQINMTSNHGYSQAYLDSLTAEANKVLASSQSTSDEITAAEHLLELIKQIKDPDGSFSIDQTGVTFMAPRNYGTGNLYYRIEISSAETGDTAFTIDVTVRSEEKPLEAAVQTLRDAVSYADTYVRIPPVDTGEENSEEG